MTRKNDVGKSTELYVCFLFWVLLKFRRKLNVATGFLVGIFCRLTEMNSLFDGSLNKTLFCAIPPGSKMGWPCGVPGISLHSISGYDLWPILGQTSLWVYPFRWRMVNHRMTWRTQMSVQVWSHDPGRVTDRSRIWREATYRVLSQPVFYRSWRDRTKKSLSSWPIVKR